VATVSGENIFFTGIYFMASLVEPVLNLFQGHLFHPGSQSGTLVRSETFWALAYKFNSCKNLCSL